MSSNQWNVLEVGERHFFLFNRSKTNIILSPSSKVDPVVVCAELEERGVPVNYTEGLREIKFTRLPGKHGDYCDNEIRISSDAATRLIICRIIVHELAHHLDFVEDIVSHPDFDDEFKKKAKLMKDKYARNDSEEYLAVGFEVYYTGTPELRSEMKRQNPILYHTIDRLHRKFGGPKMGSRGP